MLDFLTPVIVGIHLVSLHVPAHDMQQVNYGIYTQMKSGLTLGAYRNSLNRPSLYVGQSFQVGYASLLVGGVTGYARREYLGTCVNGNTGTPDNPCYQGHGGKINPFIVPSILLKDTFRISLMLSEQPALHLSMEHHF